MSDRPPPRKRSRFFSNGKSKIGNILHPFKKLSQRDDPNEHDDASPGTGAADSALPSSNNPPDSSLHFSPPQTTASIDPSVAASQSPSASHVTNTNNQLNTETRRNPHKRRRPPQQQVSDSEAETDVEERNGDRQDQTWDESDTENADPDRSNQTTPAVDGLAVRDRRREGIYGVESLLAQSTNTTGQPTNTSASDQAGTASQGSGSGPESSSNANTGTNADSDSGPIAIQHTFTGVSSLVQLAANLGQIPAGHPLLRPAFEPFTTTRLTARPMPNEPNVPTSWNAEQPPSGRGQGQLTRNTLRIDGGVSNSSGPSNPSRLLPAALPTGGIAPYVDIDRDARGRRLARPPALTNAALFYNGQLPPEYANSLGIPPPIVTPAVHLANPESLVPEHMYMAPNRVERAQHYARISLKRKRPEAILPPPSYIYQRTNKPDFNVFDGILLYPELVFALASALPVKDLISLYAISKDFHTILDTRFTTVVLNQAITKAPESARTFSFRSYAYLCRQDPVARIPHPNARMAERKVPRKVPSFRWLKMVLHREKVVHELMAVFAEDGIPLPFRCGLAIKRLWFMLDIPDNARRIGYCHNKRLMSDLDLFFAACFFTKLDLRLNDPTAGEKRDGMRKLLLSQRSFTTILKVLKREIWTTRFAALQEWVKLKYQPLPDERSLPIFGIPSHQVGRGRLEYWGLRTAEQIGREPENLLRPDQLIVREAFRRGIPFGEDYIRFVLYGYVDPETLENCAPRNYGRRIESIKDDEYDIDDAIGGVAALGVGDEGFDDLLDLGPPRQGSIYTIVADETSKAEKDLRAKEDRFLKNCLEWWKEETKEEMNRQDDSKRPNVDG
ncbi:hypothetical protein A1O1_02408 [Capronia coronata CBS 617.96]|uniref:F-box domain-containing protein n=1 Tax=Capronia coronata CBS 617.96 TaxID=1182541 RepID=W9YWG4_9EURO|nr:uncharacterized protein A1O1_02408 [Capronia coronata CBS 617.96]EXJ94015.1 hypothetical protein A1O1_02408 [Capronia coronata CBS 617.96]